MRYRTAAIGATVAVMLAATACSYAGEGPLLTKDDLAGTTSSQTRDLDNFTGVSVGGYADLTVTEGADFEVVVTTDENLQEHVGARVDNHTLIITQEYSYFGTPPSVEIAVTVPVLSDVNLSGSSDASIRVSNPESLRVGVSGSADVELHADPKALTLSVSGSGSIAAHGTVDSAQISVSGSGEVDGADLTAADAKITVSGSGDASVRARSTLDARVSGSGNVSYFGDPEVTTSLSGSGDVHRAGE